MANVRTTIVLPKEDVRHIKMLAAMYGLTMSEVIQKSVRNAGQILSEKKKRKGKKVGWRAFAGSLNLGGKEPSTRAQLYEDYFNEKKSSR